jgi:hypothetical protein
VSGCVLGYRYGMDPKATENRLRRWARRHGRELVKIEAGWLPARSKRRWLVVNRDQQRVEPGEELMTLVAVERYLQALQREVEQKRARLRAILDEPGIPLREYLQTFYALDALPDPPRRDAGIARKPADPNPRKRPGTAGTARGLTHGGTRERSTH